MWKQKLCLGLLESYGTASLPRPMPPKDEIALFYTTGFEGFFTGWGGSEYLKNCRKTADALGMLYQSVHAPFGRMRDLWHGDAEAVKTAVDEQIRCLEDCAAVGVPIMIAHVFIGFEDHEPNEAGVENFEKIVRRARELGVKIAFENTEGMEYLAAVMKTLAPAYPDTVGFCWDTGHEMCYNWSQDMTALYGDRLIATHINDNLGIRDYGGKITWHDDLHLLPFDGIADWQSVAARLKDFDGPLTFELTTHSKPQRHENDAYGRMTPEDYLAEAYKRACRVAALLAKERA